ncbi:MAG TPA: hypothetical protein VIY48_04385 [Candidatus Paceibacterota bacterium]
MITRLYLWACICAIWALQTAIAVVTGGATAQFTFKLVATLAN